MTLTTLRTHRTRLKMRRVAVGAAGRQPARRRVVLPALRRRWCCPRGEGGGVARRASSVFSRELSGAKPTGCRLLHLSFPARESSILLRDDSSGNLGLGSLSGGIATLNPRLNLDYPLSGKELSDFSCQLSDFSFQRGIQIDKGSEGTEFFSAYEKIGFF